MPSKKKVLLPTETSILKELDSYSFIFPSDAIDPYISGEVPERIIVDGNKVSGTLLPFSDQPMFSKNKPIIKLDGSNWTELYPIKTYTFVFSLFYTILEPVEPKPDSGTNPSSDPTPEPTPSYIEVEYEQPFQITMNIDNDLFTAIFIKEWVNTGTTIVGEVPVKHSLFFDGITYTKDNYKDYLKDILHIDPKYII